jgi:Seven in absentia protein family
LHLLTLKNAEENPDAIECLGNLLKIWQCNWNGSKKEFHEHFIRSHNNIEIFSQFQVSSVPFQSDQLLSAMTLIRAFESTFVFYYHANPSTKMIYFLIFLLDEEEQPQPESFLYELMIKSPNENHCKVIN